jgi:curved DNA-binding protein CbpA
MLGELITKESIELSEIIPAVQNHTEELRNKLNSAQRLGNEFKAKADITFNTKQGPKTVNTTVWSVTEKYLQLKSGVHIPLSSLIDIDF